LTQIPWVVARAICPPVPHPFEVMTTWEEIEDMLNRAEAKRAEWKVWFDECRKNEDRDGMKEAARNHKALDGVVKTLKWALGEEGISNPLE